MTDNKNVFEIGLAMAGAISAGAYSAGVVDFLFQALDQWELFKRDHPNEVPNHSVCIRAAAGASAGSITAALAAVAVAGGLRPEKVKNPKVGEQPYRCVLPALYKAWVTMPDMASPHGKPDLLATDELKDGVPPQSILNAQILDALTDEALELPAPAAGSLLGPAYGGNPLPYFAERLHLYLTLSNLRGVPYVVGFEGSDSTRGHYMMSHGDRAHYTLEGIGTHGGENAWLSKDNCDPLKITTVPRADRARDSTYEDWQRYGRAALASAAFPLGLAARHIDSNVDKYKARAWPGLPGAGTGFPPRWPDSWPKDNYNFGFMSVDGGLIDNEPFEYVRRAIMRDDEDEKDEMPDESCVRGAVLMVDPFPEPPTFSLREISEASLFDVARAVFPMLKNQVRFKPDALAKALNNNNYSRWMIAPSRTLPPCPGEKDEKEKDKKAEKNERYAIATGVLGGFGGFLDESFRAHDYQLGRRNCQKFLRDIFSVGQGHPFVDDWPLGVAERFCKFDAASTKKYWPVIPLVGTAALEVPPPEWPRIDYERLAKIEQRIRQRASYVVPRLVTSKMRHKAVNLAARTLWRWPCKSRLLKVVHRAIEADLIRRDQLKTEMPYSTQAREVLAELNAPGYDYRTIDGLDKAIYLNKEEVCAALDELKKTPNLLWTGKVNNQECCVLKTRRPKWWQRNDPLRGEPRIG